MTSRLRNLGSGLVPLVAIGGLGLIAGTTTVPANHVAHTNLFGNVSTTKMKSGIHLVNPLCSVIKIPLLTHNLSSNVTVASNEGLSLQVETNTIYRVKEDDAREIYLKFRDSCEHVLIRPLIESMLRDILSSYEAKALYSNDTRNQIKTKMEKEIKSKLLASGIIVDDFLINKIKLPDQLQSSIENKLKVEQENEQMEFTIEKERKRAAFALEKEKMEADRKVIEATGIQKFQQIVSQGISDKLIAWKTIEAYDKLASSSNTKILIPNDLKSAIVNLDK